MSWSTPTTWARRKLLSTLLACLSGMGMAVRPAAAQDTALRVPSAVAAGSALSLETDGQGSATFYLVGEGRTIKQAVSLGRPIALKPDDLRSAGRYLAILCARSCQSTAFYVTPAEAEYLDFLVHPSRAPVGQPDVISGVAFPIDRFHNLLLSSGTVDFRMTSDGVAPVSHTVALQNGVAWFRASSGHRAGALQMFASMGEVSARRVVQQVASDPCHLRITAQTSPKGIMVATDPVRDCAGNPVPDGTMVSFTKVDAGGQSTVDAPVKKGIATAQMTAHGPAVISVAAGLVMGNQVRVGGR